MATKQVDAANVLGYGLLSFGLLMLYAAYKNESAIAIIRNSLNGKGGTATLSSASYGGSGSAPLA